VAGGEHRPRRADSTGWGNLVVAALLLGIVNAVIPPDHPDSHLRSTVLTLGLHPGRERDFGFALVAWAHAGFTLAGLWAAILTSIVWPDELVRLRVRRGSAGSSATAASK